MTWHLDSAARAAAEARVAASTHRPENRETKIMSFTEAPALSPLSDLQRQVLDIARDLATIPDVGGRHHQYIVTRLGMGTTAYYQHLNRLLDSQAALAEYPVLINRLRRIRDARNAQRGH